MENRNLGRGRGRVSVPVVGLGTWRRLEAAAASGRHRELTDAAIAAGIRLFDTSPMYGEAERLLADALDGQRGQVLIADKIWTRPRRRARCSWPARRPGTAAGST
jgi:aryl-alcohol dehydrogenase-like predicted oxidoreductase